MCVLLSARVRITANEKEREKAGKTILALRFEFKARVENSYDHGCLHRNATEIYGKT